GPRGYSGSVRQPPFRNADRVPVAGPAAAAHSAVTPIAAPKGVAVLGSTGSIGTTALRVLDRQRDRFRVTALTGNSNAALLREQARKFSPSFVGMVESQGDVDDAWNSGTEALVTAATRNDVDIVLNAIVGVAGLERRATRLRDCRGRASSSNVANGTQDHHR